MENKAKTVVYTRGKYNITVKYGDKNLTDCIKSIIKLKLPLAK